MASSEPRADGSAGGISPFKLALQVLLAAAAFALWDTCFLQPLKLLVVLLHELSHGLMALATGGSVIDIVVTPSEGGACHTAGGNAVLIVSAGYLGSMFFGGVLLAASRARAATAASYFVLALLLTGAAFTVIRDSYSHKFALAVAGTAVVVGGLAPGFVASLALRGIGTVSTLYSLLDIYNDVLSKSAVEHGVESDARALAELTGLPSTAIGLAWMAVALCYLVVALRSSISEGGAARSASPKGSEAPASA
jgi:hypothetical protein